MGLNLSPGGLPSLCLNFLFFETGNRTPHRLVERVTGEVLYLMQGLASHIGLVSLGSSGFLGHGFGILGQTIALKTVLCIVGCSVASLAFSFKMYSAYFRIKPGFASSL